MKPLCRGLPHTPAVAKPREQRCDIETDAIPFFESKREKWTDIQAILTLLAGKANQNGKPDWLQKKHFSFCVSDATIVLIRLTFFTFSTGETLCLKEYSCHSSPKSTNVEITNVSHCPIVHMNEKKCRNDANGQLGAI